MSFFEAILLGLVQGATEFLPVSSSGHLLLVPALLKLTEPGLTLIAFVHEGTLLAILLYFRRDLWQVLKAMLDALRQRQPLATAEARLGWYIVVGSIPAAAAGLTLQQAFENLFSTPRTAAFLLLGTAALLIAGERMLSGDKGITGMSWLDAIVIGLAQMLALLPGISRSGSTIAAGLWRGLDRATAARYSFLLGVPAILGAGIVAVLDILRANSLMDQWTLLLASFAAAAISGYLCIRFLLSWLQRRSLYIFASYCIIFALVSLAILLAR